MSNIPGGYALPETPALVGQALVGQTLVGGSGFINSVGVDHAARPPRVEGSAPLPAFEENQDFNEWLDEQYGSIKIGDIELYASAVLYAAEAETYRIMLSDYRNDNPSQTPKVNLAKPLYDKYPLPLAFHIQRLHRGYENDSQRRDVMVDVWEHLIRVLYAVVVGEFRCKGYTITDPKVTEQQVWSDSLDTKLALLKKLHAVAAQKGYPSNSLALFDETVIDRLSALNRLRNGFKHTAAPTVAKAASQTQETLYDLASALDAVRGFAQVSLIRLSGVSGSFLTPKVESFIGSSLSRSFPQIVLKPQQLAPASAYLNDHEIAAMIGDDIFSVSPFLHFDERADLSTHGRITIYKKKTPSKTKPMLTFEVLDAADGSVGSC